MNLPERHPHRIAIVLGPGGASRYLLDCVQPLLSPDRDIELQGVFMEEAGVQHAAAMPFVKELCRVTFAVREFDGEQVERALMLRMRTARRALAVLAERSGASHSFQSLRGSAIELLRRAADEADVVLFEPVHPRTFPLSAAVSRPGRVTVLLSGPESGPRVLRAASGLVRGDARRISCLLLPGRDTAASELENLVRSHFADSVSPRRLQQGDPGQLAVAVRETSASLLVVPADGPLTAPPMMRFLREQIRCPVCLIRRWEE